jgi:hypothetical protein
VDNKINICAYCRVSTNKKDQENSFQNQKDYFITEIANNPKYNLVKIYADKGISATSMNKREQFKQMVIDAGIDIKEHNYQYENRQKKESYYILSERVPKFERILVKNSSRFSRNIDIIDLLRKLRSKGVYVDFLDIGKTTEIDSDFVYLEISITLDENESRDKSRKVKFGINRSIKQKVINTPTNIFGYNKINKYQLEINEKQAEIVRIIYEKYAEGFGFRRIINYLDENEYKAESGKSFVVNTIKRILSNEKYKGWLVRNKYTTGTIFVDKIPSPKLRPEAEWVIYKIEESGIPPIVSEELWDKCEQVRKSKINYTEQKGIYHGISEYSGLLFCGKCGHTYSRNIDKGRIFYNCGLKKLKGTTSCDNINISSDKLEDVIDLFINQEYFNHVASNIAFIKNEIDKLIYEQKERLVQEVDFERIEILNIEITHLKESQKNVLEYIADERISKDVIDNMLNEINDNMQKKIYEKDELSKSKEEINNIIKEYEKEKEILQELQINKRISKEQFLENVIKIEVFKGNKEVHYYEDEKTIVVKFHFEDFIMPYKIGIKADNSFILYN